MLHHKRHPEQHHGFVNPPVYHGSTVIFPTLEEYERSYENRFVPETVGYGRRGNPTAFSLESTVANLESGYACFSVCSGLAAVTTSLMTFLGTGDHLLIADTVYQPTREFCDNILSAHGVDVTYYDPLIGQGIRHLVRQNTKCIYMESPGSLTFEIQDVPAIVKIAKEKNITTLLDNTWASPFFFRPIEHGVNISINAATKYISGHSDLMLGLITTDKDHYLPVRKTKEALGQCVGPDDLYLALRGMRTLPLRMQQHQKQALEVAGWLQNHPAVIKILHPAFDNCPGHEIWKRDFCGSTGLFSFVLENKSKNAVARFLDNLNLISIGASWGAYESLILPVDPRNSRTATKWENKGLILRLHVGLEDVRDLISDLDQGLKRFNQSE